MATIILTGGGTGGHIMPNLALIPHLKEHFDRIVYVGGRNSVEERICKDRSIEFYSTDTIKLYRREVYKNLAIPFILPKSINQAKEIFLSVSPCVVFSKGGYASLPTVLAAKRLNVPYVIHESDKTLGVANKLVAKRASTVIFSAKQEKLPPNGAVLQNPIREEILHGKASKIDIYHQLRAGKPKLLVVGGSQGAKFINDLIIENINLLCDKYDVIHITGKNPERTIVHSGYYSLQYAENMGDYYDVADIILSRSGAGALTEIDALSKRVIYIPLPKGNSRGDQIDNAVHSGSAYILQEEMSSDKLLKTIYNVLQSPPPKSHYDIQTPAKIVKLILSAAGINN